MWNKIKASVAKFWHDHLIISNSILIVISFFVLGWLSLLFLDVWTHHGQTATVPKIEGMKLDRATAMLHDAGLEVVVQDSVYMRDKPAGTVVDVIPQPGAVVKRGREVFVTIVAFSPEPITIDMPLNDISWRQAESYLKSRGLRVEKRYVPSQYADVVVSAKVGNRYIGLGDRVTVDDVVTLEVGRIPEPVRADTIPMLTMGIDDTITALIEADSLSNAGYDD